MSNVVVVNCPHCGQQKHRADVEYLRNRGAGFESPYVDANNKAIAFETSGNEVCDECCKDFAWHLDIKVIARVSPLEWQEMEEL